MLNSKKKANVKNLGRIEVCSVSEIIKANELYERERKALAELWNKTTLINDCLDLNEVKGNLSYKETKSLYNTVIYSCNNKEKLNMLEEILKEKKIKEYPEVLDVHYYPVIKNIDFLSDNEKIDLDKTIKNAYLIRLSRGKLNELNNKILHFLLTNKIIERQYIFHCSCGDDECYDEVITESLFDKLKDYWQRETTNDTTHEDDKEMNYGCFETGCWNDGNVEVCSLEDFNNNLKRIEYKVVKEPDMTLDML